MKGNFMQEKILCIAGKLISGGVLSMVVSYYKCLDKSKYQYDFVFEETADCEIPEGIVEMGARVFRVPDIENPVKYCLAIRRIIKEGNYKIVHSNMNTLSVFSLSSFEEKPPFLLLARPTASISSMNTMHGAFSFA